MIRLSAVQIAEVEAAIGHALPDLYRTLLTHCGWGRAASGAEVYHPEQVRERFALFFDEQDDLFGRYVPFGCHNHAQDVWIIDVPGERAAAIGHETVPEDWPEERWLTYSQWLLKHAPDLPLGK